MRQKAPSAGSCRRGSACRKSDTLQGEPISARSSRGRNSFPLVFPLGTKFGAEPRTSPQSGSHTLSAKFSLYVSPSIRTCRLDGTFLTGRLKSDKNFYWLAAWAASASASSSSLRASSRWIQLLADLRQAGACGDQFADDDVLLQAGELILLALDGRLGQHAGGLLGRMPPTGSSQWPGRPW